MTEKTTPRSTSQKKKKIIIRKKRVSMGIASQEPVFETELPQRHSNQLENRWNLKSTILEEDEDDCPFAPAKDLVKSKYVTEKIKEIEKDMKEHQITQDDLNRPSRCSSLQKNVKKKIKISEIKKFYKNLEKDKAIEVIKKLKEK